MEKYSVKGKTKAEVVKDVEEFFGVEGEQRQAAYNRWAESYDEAMPILDYNGPKQFVDEFSTLKLSKEAKLLEVGAGTGALGSLLQSDGYKNVDALDANESMLEVAKQKGVYKNYFVRSLGKGNTIPVENDTYDAVLCVGAIGPGHIESDAFPEMIRITKPGGIVMWHNLDLERFTKDKDIKSNFKKAEFEAEIQGLCDAGAWTKLRKVTVPDSFSGVEGTLTIMKKF